MKNVLFLYSNIVKAFQVQHKYEIAFYFENKYFAILNDIMYAL